MRLLLVALCATCAWAQSGIETPSIGAVVDSSGSLRQVNGLAGNFWTSDPIISGVVSAACSERLCLVKTDSKILSATGEIEAPAGSAIFGLDGDQPIVFFPQSGTFARWHDNSLDMLDWAIDGEVLSIYGNDIAVRRDQEVQIVNRDGGLIDEIAAATGPVLLLSDGVVFATSDELILRRRNLTDIRFPLAAAESITRMGAHYIAIRAGDSRYALRIESGRESLFLLPGNSP